MQNVKSILFSITAFLLIFATACDSNDNGPDFTGESETYTLDARNGSGVTGTATFEELDGGTTQVTLDLDGTPQDGNHPAHIHFNSAAEGGDIAISLTNVDGASGESVTLIEQTNSGESISYDELLNFDGYINVHLSSSDLTVVSQTDIGANALTGNSAEYSLSTVNNSGVSGSVTFYERKDETTLGVIEVSGTPQNGNHPAHIHQNSASEGGGIAISFNNVDGATGSSRTQIEALDNGNGITYSQILNYDGYVNVHLSPEDLTVVSQGNIGSNADAQSGGGSGGSGY